MSSLLTKRITFILLVSTAILFSAVNIVPVDHSYLYSDSLYSAIYIKNAEVAEKLISSPGAGRLFTLSPDEKYVGFKYRENPGGLEAPALLEIETKKIIKLHEDTYLAGQISFSNNGMIAYTIGNDIYVKDGDNTRKYHIGVYANIAPISPDGNKVVYNDEHDQLWILDLYSEEKVQITSGKYGNAFPQWSVDSRYISFQTLDGHLMIYDHRNANSRDLGTACDLHWSKQNADYTYTKINIIDETSIESRELISCKENGEQVFQQSLGIKDQAFYNKNSELIIYTDGKIKNTQSENRLFKNNETRIELQTEAKTFAYEASAADTFLSVPYVNQVYDTPGQRGYSSCAPTTAAMVLAYYKRIPEWPFVSGFGNLSNYGAYVHERYYYNGYYFDSSYRDCNSSQSYCYTCYGGMGYMWSGGSPNSKMASYYEKHGVPAHQTWSTNWTTVRNEIDKKHPYSICNYLSGSGHLIVGLGRVSSGQRTIIANDPYGDRNSSSWPNYYGDAVYYDWPGYNHGHASLNYAYSGYTSMPWCIATSYNMPEYPDSVIDDKQFKDGFYMKAEGNTVPMRHYHSSLSGYDGHHWWTYSEADESDRCYVTWTPNVDSASYYEIFAYIPANAEATGALYRIHHAAGKRHVMIDQSAYNDEWVSLGKYMFRNDGSDYVYLGDSTGVGSEKLAFDAMRWEPVEVQNLDFTSDYTNGYPGFEVKFWVDSPISEGHYNYIWNFGDGTSAEGDSAVHVFSNTDNYSITLMAETGGINQNKVKSDMITIHENTGDFDINSPNCFDILRTNRPTITWEMAPINAQAEVMFDITPEFSDPDSLYLFPASPTYCTLTRDLPENKNVYCKVFLNSSDGTISYVSKISTFTINASNVPPLDFELIAPENGFISDTLKPIFSWEEAVDKDPGDSLIYKLYIGSSLDSVECVHIGIEPECELSYDLIENAAYKWYVDVIDMSGAVKRSSSIRDLYVNTYNEAPSAPRQLSPNHNSYQTTRYPYFEWTEAVDPDPGDEVSYKMNYWYTGSSYDYSLSTSKTFSDDRRMGNRREYFWSVSAIDKAGLFTNSDTLTYYIDIELESVDIPTEFELSGNYPNPFNPITRINYSIPSAENVTISLFDINGKFVTTLVDGLQNPGYHTITFNAAAFPSGVYVYKMIAGDFQASSKMLLLK